MSHPGVSAEPSRRLSLFVCLCTGATSEIVADVVAKGAVTSKQVAAACGAGADCGRCRRTLRAIIADAKDGSPTTARNHPTGKASAMRFGRSSTCTTDCAIGCQHMAHADAAVAGGTGAQAAGA